MLHFIKTNSNRYISNSGKFSLIKYKDWYQILMNSRIPSWSCNFSSVECAEKFLNSHDYINASINSLPMSSDDIEFIIDMYGFNNVGRNKWATDGHTLKIGRSGNDVIIDNKKFKDAVSVLDYLDSVNSSIRIIRCNSIQELKTAITAASAREITRNLVRVKSSNVWAYCIEIKDRHDKTGTMYIQFKGRNGGPTGGLYCYYDVPINLWRRFISAPSKGHFFWRYIRNNYRYSKLDGDKKGKLRNAVN